MNPDPGMQGPFLNTLFPNYADLRTDETGICPDCGIFTQTLGTAPNRQFVIRWKTTYFNSPPAPATAEFEVLLTEGSNTLSVIYGVTGDNGLTAVSGIQQDLNVFTSFSCNEATLTPGLRVDYIPTTCGSPTPTPTVTPTATATPIEGNSNANSDSNCHGNSDGYCYCHAQTYANAADSADTEASSDSAAPTVRQGDR